MEPQNDDQRQHSLLKVTDIAEKLEMSANNLTADNFACDEATVSMQLLLDEGNRVAAELEALKERLLRRHRPLTYAYEPPSHQPLLSPLAVPPSAEHHYLETGEKDLSKMDATKDISPVAPEQHPFPFASQKAAYALDTPPSERAYSHSISLLRSAIGHCEEVLQVPRHEAVINPARPQSLGYNIGSLEEQYVELDSAARCAHKCLQLCDENMSCYQRHVAETRMAWLDLQKLWQEDEAILVKQLREKGIVIPSLV